MIENIFVDSNCISYKILEEKAVLLCKTSAQYNHNSMNEWKSHIGYKTLQILSLCPFIWCHQMNWWMWKCTNANILHRLPDLQYWLFVHDSAWLLCHDCDHILSVFARSSWFIVNLPKTRPRSRSWSCQYTVISLQFTISTSMINCFDYRL